MILYAQVNPYQQHLANPTIHLRRATTFGGRRMENAAVVKVVQRCLADVTRNPARILEVFRNS